MIEPTIDVQQVIPSGDQAHVHFIAQPGSVCTEITVGWNTTEFMMQEAWQELWRIFNKRAELEKNELLLKWSKVALSKSHQWELALLKQMGGLNTPH